MTSGALQAKALMDDRFEDVQAAKTSLILNQKFDARGGSYMIWVGLRERVADSVVHDSPDTKCIIELGAMNVNIGMGTALRRQNTKMITFGLTLVEWGIKHGYETNPEEELLLAEAHCIAWISMGVKADTFNLQRSIYFYERCFKSVDLTEASSADIVLRYANALAYIGMFDRAHKMFLMLCQRFEDHKDIPNFLFYTGCALKAMGKHDEAADYFFEATQIGPPKLFSKLEMMFIISRNIEEGSKNRDVPMSDAYEMVYEHVVLEGELSADVSYDEWVSDALTWRSLGDKCMLHNQFSLACDLYGQGIVRDRSSFRKAKLWYSFAKACNRCGRTSDAQLSIKQALSMDPFNTQLNRAMEVWGAEDSRSPQEMALESVETLKPIISATPLLTDPGHLAASRMQALLRGADTRQQVMVGLGIGHHVAGAGKARPNGLVRQMTAKTAAVIKVRANPVECPNIYTYVSLYIYVRADWAGSVKEIKFMNMQNNEVGVVKLKYAFCPPKEIGEPRRYKLTLFVERCAPGEVEQSPRAHPRTPRESPRGANKQDIHVVDTDVHWLYIRYTDPSSGEFVQRRIQFKYLHLVSFEASEECGSFDALPAPINTTAGPQNTAARVSSKNRSPSKKSSKNRSSSKSGKDYKDLKNKSKSSSFAAGSTTSTLPDVLEDDPERSLSLTAGDLSIFREGEEGSMATDMGMKSLEKLYRRISLLSCISLGEESYQSSVETNIVEMDVGRGGLRLPDTIYDPDNERDPMAFMYRIYHRVDKTYIIMFCDKTGSRLQFEFAREYINRMKKLRTLLHFLYSILEKHEVLAQCFLDATSEGSAAHAELVANGAPQEGQNAEGSDVALTESGDRILDAREVGMVCNNMQLLLGVVISVVRDETNTFHRPLLAADQMSDLFAVESTVSEEPVPKLPNLVRVAVQDITTNVPKPLLIEGGGAHNAQKDYTLSFFETLVQDEEVFLGSQLAVERKQKRAEFVSECRRGGRPKTTAGATAAGRKTPKLKVPKSPDGIGTPAKAGEAAPPMTANTRNAIGDVDSRIELADESDMTTPSAVFNEDQRMIQIESRAPSDTELVLGSTLDGEPSQELKATVVAPESATPEPVASEPVAPEPVAPVVAPVAENQPSRKKKSPNKPVPKSVPAPVPEPIAVVAEPEPEPIVIAPSPAKVEKVSPKKKRGREKASPKQATPPSPTEVTPVKPVAVNRTDSMNRGVDSPATTRPPTAVVVASPGPVSPKSIPAASPTSLPSHEEDSDVDIFHREAEALVIRAIRSASPGYRTPAEVAADEAAQAAAEEEARKKVEEKAAAAKKKAEEDAAAATRRKEAADAAEATRVAQEEAARKAQEAAVAAANKAKNEADAFVRMEEEHARSVEAQKVAEEDEAKQESPPKPASPIKTRGLSVVTRKANTFFEHQALRMEAIEYLAERVDAAQQEVRRNIAYDYLSGRAGRALFWVQNPDDPDTIREKAELFGLVDTAQSLGDTEDVDNDKKRRLSKKKEDLVIPPKDEKKNKSNRKKAGIPSAAPKKKKEKTQAEKDAEEETRKKRIAEEEAAAAAAAAEAAALEESEMALAADELHAEVDYSTAFAEDEVMGSPAVSRPLSRSTSGDIGSSPSSPKRKYLTKGGGVRSRLQLKAEQDQTPPSARNARRPLNVADIPQSCLLNPAELVRALQTQTYCASFDDKNRFVGAPLPLNAEVLAEYAQSKTKMQLGDTQDLSASYRSDRGKEDGSQQGGTKKRPGATTLNLQAKLRQERNQGLRDPITFLDNFTGVKDEPDGFVPTATANRAISGKTKKMQSGELINMCLGGLKLKGYSNGECEYSSHWQLKLEKFIALHSGNQGQSVARTGKKGQSVARTGKKGSGEMNGPLQVLKNMRSMIRSHPSKLTEEEAFCALAESRGVMSEAIGKIGNIEYFSEIRLVCRILPVAALMEGLLGTAGDRSALMTSNCDKRDGEMGVETPYRAIIRERAAAKIDTAAKLGGAADKGISFKRSNSDLATILSCPPSRPVSAGRSRANSSSNTPRVPNDTKGTPSEDVGERAKQITALPSVLTQAMVVDRKEMRNNALPNLGLNSYSGPVRRRGSKVAVKQSSFNTSFKSRNLGGDSEPNSAGMDESQAVADMLASMGFEDTTPSLARSASATDGSGGYLGVISEGGAGPLSSSLREDPIPISSFEGGDSDNMRMSGDWPPKPEETENSIITFDSDVKRNTLQNKSSGNNLNILTGARLHKPVDIYDPRTTGSPEKNGGSPNHKSVRMGKIMEVEYDQNPDRELMVLSKRDAYKAHQDEILIGAADYKDHARRKKELSKKLFK